MFFISFSNGGVRYRVEDVVLDAQAAARRGTKIGEESFSNLLSFLARWKCCQMLPRSCCRSSQTLEGGFDLAAHSGYP